MVCGKERKRSNALACRDCYREARASTYLDLVCPVCSAPFKQMRAEVEKRRRRGQENFYCSPPCVKAALSARFTVGCRHCGGKIPKADGRKYCSPGCLKLARAARAETRSCPQCGVGFRPKGSRTQYCGRACANAAHSARMVGAGNAHFKTGTSYAQWFRLMRPLILQRDQYQCRVCTAPDRPYPVTRAGKTTLRSSLLVHHINERPQDNRPQNLIVLCKTCHAVHHKSAVTPYDWFASYAATATRSMTSRWKATATSLRKKYSPTTA